MVTATLLCCTSGDKFFHGLEDPIHPAEVLIEEVVEVNLQEPMIPLMFLDLPVANSLPVLYNPDVLGLPRALPTALGGVLSIGPIKLDLL